MLPVSAQFLAAIRGSHRIVSTATLMTPPGVVSVNPVGRALNILAGTVTLDGTADIRGSLDLSVKEPWPTGNTISDLVPYGSEIAITRGIVYGNGVVERAPLGIYRITDVEQDQAPKGSLRITAKDRMSVIQESDLLAEVYFGTGTTYLAIFTRLVQEVFPAMVPNWDDASAVGSGKLVGPAGLVATTGEKSRFSFLDTLVKGLGKIWYFDYAGQLQIKNPPNLPVPVWVANAGHNGVLIQADRDLTADNVYNAVVVSGEQFGQLVMPSVKVFDTDPNSVTFYGGPFGKRPLQFSDPSVNSATAPNVAATQLLLAKGLPYSVNFNQVPNPALEPYDNVTLVYPVDLSAQPNVKTEQHFLQQVVIGLGTAQGMACKTRLTTNSGVLG